MRRSRHPLGPNPVAERLLKRQDHYWRRRDSLSVTSRHDRVKVEFDHHVSTDPRDVRHLNRLPAFASNWSTGDRSLEYNVWRDAKVAAWRGFLDDHGFCWWPHKYGHVVGVPHWFIVFSLAICPTVFALRWHNHRRRRSRGACVNCGYDLRATPGRCPECGTEPAAPALTRLTSATSVESSPPEPDPAARPTQPPPPARAA